MIVGSLAGCGGGGSDSSDEPKKTADGATELEFWTFTEIHGDFYETMAEKWNEANPDKKVSINVNVMPYDDMHNKLQIALNDGEGTPDFVDIEQGKFANFTQGTPALMDLTEVASQYTADGSIVQSRLDLYSKDGALYGLPTHVGATVAFYNTELETITFADDGTEKLTIGEGAFYGPYSGAPITSIVLPSREVEIGNEAFAENGDLETLDLGGTISIGDRAFAETGSDLALVIPNTVQSIGFEAFAGSYSYGIVSVEFEENSTLKTIGANAFADSKITTITIPASVETIGAAAFRDSSLTELLFEEGDLPLAFGVAHENSVGNVIYGTDITTINFPGRLTELSERALAVGYSWSDPQAVTVTFGNQYEGFNESKLTTIGAYAFENLGLTSITIPKSVQNTDVIAIGNNAVDACGLLESVTFEEGGTGTITIGASAFVGCNSLESITLPANLGNFTAADGTVTAALANGVGVFIPDYGTSDSKLASIEVAEGNAIYASANGMLYSSDFTTLIFCPPAKSGVVTIDKRTETVGSNAFLSCSAVTEINFEEGSVCTEIEEM